MKTFSILLQEIEGIKNDTNIVDAVLRYLKNSPESNALAGVSLLLGYKPAKLLTPEKLKAFAMIYTGYPEYLFEESQAITGDLIETISLITGNPDSDASVSLDDLLRNQLVGLKSMGDEELRNEIFLLWKSLPAKDKLLFNRLITGKFRSPVDEHTVLKALSEHYRISIKTIYILLETHQNEKEPLRADMFGNRAFDDNSTANDSFFIPKQAADVHELPSENDFWILHPWGNGLRVRLEISDTRVYLWSEEWRLLNTYFPEVISAGGDILPGTVFEGELIAENKEESKEIIEKRMRTKNPNQKSIAENKVLLSITDCLKHNGTDISNWFFAERLNVVEKAVSAAGGDIIRFELPEKAKRVLEINEYLMKSISSGADGVLIQNSKGIYGEGFLLKNKPQTINAVLMYAQQGKGNYTGIYSEYSWGITRGDGIVVIARSNIGLTEDEILQTDKFVKEKRTERFGPVAVVPPEIWAEITYEREEVSKRHKAGVVLRNISKVKLIKN